MENPYATPPPAFNAPGGYELPPGARQRGLVGHVRVIGVLMIAQGVLNLLMGLLYVAMAVLFPWMMVQHEGFPEAGQDAFEAMRWGMLAAYVVMGSGGLIPGVLNIYGGWRTFQFRSRTLAIVSLVSGLATLLTCYCVLTSAPLMIYGLIVLLNPSVREAFALGEQGYTADQIDALFNPWATVPDLGKDFPPGP